VTPVVCIRGACEEALREHAPMLQDHAFLLVTSEEGRPNLRHELTKIGATIEAVAAYRYIQRMPSGPLPPIDLVVLPSSSAARAVLSGNLGKPLHAVPMIAIGPQTEKAARECGARHVVRAEADTPSSLVSLAVSLMGAI
jgi:uroporphyrinogen III methyltransferase/synthase